MIQNKMEALGIKTGFGSRKLMKTVGLRWSVDLAVLREVTKGRRPPLIFALFLLICI